MAYMTMIVNSNPMIGRFIGSYAQAGLQSPQFADEDVASNESTTG